MSKLQRVEDESELEEIKRRLFGDGNATHVVEKRRKKKRTCECAFRSTYPHDHIRVSFQCQSLGLKFREGCIVRLRKDTEKKYDVRVGDFIHVVNENNVNLFQDHGEELDVDRRILKHFMQVHNVHPQLTLSIYFHTHT